MADAEFSVRIWGARGSISAPAATNCTYGSDTCCVEMRCGERVLVFDAGTGAVSLGAAMGKSGIRDFDLFFTHCHFDHIIGLPFMAPLYCADVSLRLYAGHFLDDTTGAEMVDGFMRAPYFPVTPKHFRAAIAFVDFRPPATFDLGDGISVKTHRLEHPNGAVGYRVDFDGRSVCYLTDLEQAPGPADPALAAFAAKADIVIYDATFTDDEYENYRGFGHSTWQQGIRVCEAAGARHLVIFHHRHDRDDAALQALETEAQARFPGAVVAKTGLVLWPGQPI